MLDRVKRYLAGDEGLRRLHDVLGMQRLGPLHRGYVPWTDSAMRPQAVSVLLNEVVLNDRRAVVECGGGVSSLYLAEILRRTDDGRLFVLEHDREWAERLQRIFEQRGVDEVTTVLHAPLAAAEELALDGSEWYSREVLAARLSDVSVDLLVVDGPPAHTEDTRYSRYPAVPYFRGQLTSEAVIVLDDIDREAEQEIVRRWEALLDVSFQHREVEAGIARASLVASNTV